MYVMLNDGGIVEPNASTTEVDCILAQRVMMLELMSQDLACCLLLGAEFRDSKVSFCSSVEVPRCGC
jgi:hypothetical protein